jgi:hypothetical protein
MIKTCKKCNESIPLEDFPPAKQNKSGYHSYCRPCLNKYLKDRERKKKIAYDTHESEIPVIVPKTAQEYLEDVHRVLARRMCSNPVGLKIKENEYYLTNDEWLNPYFINWNDVFLPLEQWSIEYWTEKQERVHVKSRELSTYEGDLKRYNSYLQPDKDYGINDEGKLVLYPYY